MKKNYDFSKSEPNPYWKKIIKEGVQVSHDVKINLKDVINSGEVLKENKELKKRVTHLENKIEILEKKFRKIELKK